MDMLKRDGGFTLIEMITVLIIVGIIATISGMAIVTGVRGYLFAKDNVIISQRAQMTMARITRELMEMTEINCATDTPTRLTYERWDGGTAIKQTLYLDETDETDKMVMLSSDAIDCADDPSGGDILVAGVSRFTLSFYKEGSGSPWGDTWTTGDAMKDLTAVRIDLDLIRTEDNRTVEFSTMVSPRNVRKY